MSYEQKLSEEAALWGEVAQQSAEKTPPDWNYHQYLRHNRIMHAYNINTMLAQISSDMTVAELGCGSGWLTLATAQQGARAIGYDISENAIAIANNYYETVREGISGSAQYIVADLNTVELEANSFDLILTKGTLHHLVNLPHIMTVIYNALKPGGLFWISDTMMDEVFSTTLLAAGFMFILPTHVSYREKIGGLLRFGTRAPSRIKASMEAEGLSPFEGAGRDHDWVSLLEEKFIIEKRINHPAITGYITAQVNMPDVIAIPMLKAMYHVDKFFVRLGLLKNSGAVFYARKS